MKHKNTRSLFDLLKQAQECNRDLSWLVLIEDGIKICTSMATIRHQKSRYFMVFDALKFVSFILM